jgi:RNA polymerase sigma factor (TIGR02999 family)
MESKKQITRILNEWRGGSQDAFNQLFPLVYDELRVMASSYMRRERADHTLQTTALVNEAYLKLVNQSDATWENRVHFFAVAARVMRHILIDHARTRNYAKREGGAVKLSLDEVAVISEQRAAELVALDDALKQLAEIDARQSRIVELRYFGGLTIAETAEVLKVSADTVKRDWNTAKLWLYRRIKSAK